MGTFISESTTARPRAGHVATRGAGLRLVIGFGVVALAMTGIFDAAEWYAEEVSLPRYCDDPDAAIAQVHQILVEERPAGQEPTRAFVVAAKLIYLVPRGAGEPIPDYLVRLRERIGAPCR
jgi:hypothetical protein